jgi:AcrR family transcriptional regulator
VVVRARVDREVVIAAAEALVDRDGWAYLTMTELAKQLGVRGPSLYGHVESVDALRGQVQARALRDLGLELQRAAMGKSGAAGLRALAAALRGFAQRHPGLYELATLEPIDRSAMIEAGRAAGAALEAVVCSFGLDRLTNELSFGCLALLHGPLSLERAGLYKGALLDVDAVYDQVVELVVDLVERAASGVDERRAGTRRAARA